MTQHTFLESFDRASGSVAVKTDPAELAKLEAIKTEAFESGYRSGWDDAIASDKDARQRIEAEFERNIQGLAFTYNEAVDRVRSELKGFVSALLDQVLPSLLPELIREQVRADLVSLGDEQIELPVEIVASSDSLQLLSQMIEDDLAMDITLVEDASLANGQVFVRMVSRETLIDFEPFIQNLSRQFAALCEPTEKGKEDCA